MINLNALVYFVETARLRSFTQAAHTLGVSQSTVSKMIKTLENSVGDALIVRQSKPFKLTAIGEHLYSKGQHILQAITERSEEHTSELQSRFDLVCRLLLEKKKN